jgi:hypothetical protein
VQEKIVYAGVHGRSFRQASDSLRMLADLDVPTKQVERVTERIGQERVAEREEAVATYEALPLAEKHASQAGVAAPRVAAVLVDGGRLQIRDTANESEETAGVEEGERQGHWREDRVGLLLAMESEATAVDPCSEIPEHFVDPTRILKLARELKPVKVGEDAVAEPSVAEAHVATESASTGPKEYSPPEIVQRRVLASRKNWHVFALQVALAARAMGLLGATRKAFIGDGAESNWTLWRRCFASFVPILDFIHALSYIFAAALAGRKFAEGWPVYVRWISWVWQGRVEQVIAELAQRQAELGCPDKEEPTTSPRQIVARTLTYLQNHKDKMRYDEYRRQGLPLTSSHIESVIKEINYRVKGTEKFWCEDGAETVLQLRADYLSDDQPLADFWKRRQDRQTGQRAYRRAA